MGGEGGVVQPNKILINWLVAMNKSLYILRACMYHVPLMCVVHVNDMHTVKSLNADTSRTVLKYPNYQGVFFQGFELSRVSCLGPRDSVLFIEVSLFQEVHI